MSPDLNPIEHVWDVLGKRLRTLRTPPQTLQELGASLVEQWRRYFTCPNYFRCDGVCIRLQDVCDGTRHCADGQDELYCDQDEFCPPGCTCTGRVVQCTDSSRYNRSWTNFHPDTRALDLSHVFLGAVTEYYVSNISMELSWLAHLNLSATNQTSVPVNLKLPNLYFLDLSFNNITVLRTGVFKFLPNLRFLNLTNNLKLSHIEQRAFLGLDKLEFLDLSHTVLGTLESLVFQPLVMLQFLNISNCYLDVMEKKSFSGLNKLLYLDIRDNNIRTFYSGQFRDLIEIHVVYASSQTFCCGAFWKGILLDRDECIAPEDSISSCEDLLQKNSFRVLLWVFSIMALTGNATVIIFRICFDSSSIGRTFGVFVTNLAFTDFCMGIYMLIICVADTTYRDTYLFYEWRWRNSSFCKLAGFLSTVSSLGSSIFVCLITLDRFLVVRFPLGQVRFRPKCTMIVSVVVWAAMIATVMVPLTPPMDQWNLFGQNGVCLALPLSSERLPGWLFSTSLFIGFNFVAFLFTAIGQIAIYKTMTNMSLIQSKKRSDQDMKVARKLSLIVLTNFSCWFPICVMGLAAMNGVDIGGDIYAWVAVFVLPVNSAINPFIYTIPSLFHKKAKKEPATALHLSTYLPTVSETVSDHLVYAGDPDPGMKPMRDLMRNGMLSPNHVQWVCGNVMSALPSLDVDTDQHRPIKLFVKMTGNVPSRICITFDKDGKECYENAIERGLGTILNKLAFY
ncbi:G-protein coupled receptor GRL101-like [Gigantopelta aegis]|uniref:G-protein coupled receptor GRL101-like n=1 Tax=Gigantopelta aegis TaxID=1735272 RepID=UPI001B887BD9|nr:G-protein coupled receptor GRL101-like [Gigantopelta aegis]